MMQSSLARKLRVLRAAKGWTLREAAAEVGCTKETLSNLERGLQHPHDITLSRIAEGYGVAFEELLEEPVTLGEVAGRDLPNSITELLERRHTETRHLADPNLVIKLGVSPIEDVLQIVREVSEELEAIGPDLTRLAQLRDNPEAMRLFSEVSRQAWTTHLALPARRGQKFVQALPAPVPQSPPEFEILPELESEINEAVRKFEEARRPLLAEVGA